MTTRDDNDIPVLYGVSHLDGVTPVRIHFDPNSRAILVDASTSIAFDPTINAFQGNGVLLAKATSSDDDSTTRPWVVNASTGAVLIDN